MLNDLKKKHEVAQEGEQETRHTSPVVVYVMTATIIIVVFVIIGAILEVLERAGY